MKKFAAVLLTVVVLVSFAACTKQKNEPETTTQNGFISSTDADNFTDETVTEQSVESTNQTTEKAETKKSPTHNVKATKPTTTKKKDSFLASIPAMSTAPPITSMHKDPVNTQQNTTQAVTTTQAPTTAPSFLDTTEFEPVTEAKLPEYDDSDNIDDSMASASPEAIRQCARSMEQSLNNHAYAIQSLVNYCETADEVHIEYFYGFVESAYIAVVQAHDIHMQYENMQSMCDHLEKSLDILYKILTESYTPLELEEMLNESAVHLEKVYNKCVALAGK
ncbi:MAG: hypothetical protein IKK09_07570 [Clostridia bacterium]|nr:hypothetical protein [Clostridia bacterium]